MSDGAVEATKAAPIGPVSGPVVPRFAGAQRGAARALPLGHKHLPRALHSQSARLLLRRTHAEPPTPGRSTFCRLPELREVKNVSVAYLGVPFDGGCSYRPGARFGPQAIRQASRNLRTQYHPAYDKEPHAFAAEPYAAVQAADAGDVSCNPFCIGDALTQIQATADECLESAKALVCLGGDHTIALPLLRSINRLHGPVCLIHIDAHLDTWDTYMNCATTHGTPFRRAAEEKLFLSDSSVHIGIRGPLYSRHDFSRDAELGFCIVHADEFTTKGVDDIVRRVRERVGSNPVYLVRAPAPCVVRFVRIPLTRATAPVD